MIRLFHYTCDHVFDAIVRDGFLRPFRQLTLPGQPALIWFTDLAIPDRDKLGMTSHVVDCDRIAHRIMVSVSVDVVTRWTVYARDFTGIQRQLLEQTRGVAPKHWWIADVPLVIDKAQ